MTIIVTGGAGFIGSNFVIGWLASHNEPVINIDKLTYAGNLENLASIKGDPRHIFVHGDIRDSALLSRLFSEHSPRAIVNFAAESHVDRSIAGPSEFINTNIVGTFCLLEASRAYLDAAEASARTAFRFVHVSTDEVYGSLGPADEAFSEKTAYAPNSPYSASKAASDHLVRAYHHTYGLPTLTTNCSNNYGPYQNTEKLIPLMIRNALRGAPIPIYGDGLNVRDWLFVEDHCSALRAVLEQGLPGESYAIGGKSEMCNLDVAKIVCGLLDRWRPAEQAHADLITFVPDRPGHDRRYAIDTRKIETELGWKPLETFESGIARTTRWYLDHANWMPRDGDKDKPIAKT